MQLGKAQITALGNPASRVRVDVAAQRRADLAGRVLHIAVEIRHQLAHSCFVTGVTLSLLRMLIGRQQVKRLNGCHTVALAHQPATGFPGQVIQRQVTGVGRHHIQRTTGALRARP